MNEEEKRWVESGYLYEITLIDFATYKTFKINGKEYIVSRVH